MVNLWEWLVANSRAASASLQVPALLGGRNTRLLAAVQSHLHRPIILYQPAHQYMLMLKEREGDVNFVSSQGMVGQ